MWATHVIFNFLETTLQNRKKKQDDFNILFYLVQYLKILSYQNVINIKLTRLFVLCFLLSLGIWYVFFTYSMFQFGLAILHMFPTHIRLVAILLGSTDLEFLTPQRLLLSNYTKLLLLTFWVKEPIDNEKFYTI